MNDLAALLARASQEATDWDATGLPPQMVAEVARTGVLAMDRPRELGGAGADALDTGIVAAELGAVCGALRVLFTTQGMVAATVDRWGTDAQRKRWLPGLADGTRLTAFATTATGTVDDPPVAVRFTGSGARLRATGVEEWVSFAASAGTALVAGQHDDGAMVALIDLDAPGVTVEPVTGQFGTRGAHPAHLRFDTASVRVDDVLAWPGSDIARVLGTALDHSNYTTAWGCAGMARACLADAVAHVRATTGRHPSIRATLGRTWVRVASARALCARAAAERLDGAPSARITTVAARYAATSAAVTAADNAVLLMGAAGCAPDSRVARFSRDARMTRIVENARDLTEQDLGDLALHADVLW